VLARLTFVGAIGAKAIVVELVLATLGLAFLAEENWVQSAVDVVWVATWG
jgi:hypothetical protein